MLNATVGVLVDDEVLVPRTLRFLKGEPDRYVVQALRRLARRVIVKRFVDAVDLVEWVRKVKPDVVFNVTEHADGDRAKDGHICALLELLGVPYTGPGPTGLMLCRDKALSKVVAREQGFRAPDFVIIGAGRRPNLSDVTFPLIVKPRFGDASEGISRSSVVDDRAALLRRVRYLRKAEPGDVICEEFVAGREMMVNFVGDRVMPVREFVLRKEVQGQRFVASSRFKLDRAHRRRWLKRVESAQLTRAQARTIADLTRRTARALGLRDYGRFDVRLTPEGEWAFIEANPNPSLIPSHLTWSGTWTGIRHAHLIGEIVRLALRRRKRRAG